MYSDINTRAELQLISFKRSKLETEDILENHVNVSTDFPPEKKSAAYFYIWASNRKNAELSSNTEEGQMLRHTYYSMTDPACNEGAVPSSPDHADQRRDDVQSSTDGSADEILQRRRGWRTAAVIHDSCVAKWKRYFPKMSTICRGFPVNDVNMPSWL